MTLPSGTRSRLFCALTFLAVLAAAPACEDDENGTVTFTPVSRTPAPEQVYLDLDFTDPDSAALVIRVRDTDDIQRVDLRLQYDPNVAIYRDFAPGLLLEQNGATVVYGVAEESPGVLRIQIERTTGTADAGTSDPQLIQLGFDVRVGTSAISFVSGAQLFDGSDVAIPGVTFFGGILTRS
jgi:hypothetical protein